MSRWVFVIRPTKLHAVLWSFVFARWVDPGSCKEIEVVRSGSMQAWSSFLKCENENNTSTHSMTMNRMNLLLYRWIIGVFWNGHKKNYTFSLNNEDSLNLHFFFMFFPQRQWPRHHERHVRHLHGTPRQRCQTGHLRSQEWPSQDLEKKAPQICSWRAVEVDQSNDWMVRNYKL